MGVMAFGAAPDITTIRLRGSRSDSYGIEPVGFAAQPARSHVAVREGVSPLRLTDDDNRGVLLLLRSEVQYPKNAQRE